MRDKATQEGDIRPWTDGRVNIGDCARTGEARIDVNDFRAMFEPMTTTQSESSMLRGYIVAAPRPSLVPRPGTLELCHIRA